MQVHTYRIYPGKKAEAINTVLTANRGIDRHDKEGE